jgi:hypothetical protein
MGLTMSWDALGALAELFGAIAVFATLIYLSVQIRQSNRLALAEYREMNRISMIDLSDPIIRDEEFAELLEEAKTNYDDLSAANQRRVRLQVQNELLAAQSLFVRGKLMGEERMERVSCGLALNTIVNHPVAQDVWQQTEYDEAFTLIVNRQLDDQST